MDGKRLYAEVQALKIPFYEQAKWIETRFEREWFDHMYRKTKRIRSRPPQQIPGYVR